MFRKVGELISITSDSFQQPESIISNLDVNGRFEKFATELRKIAPKAKDFLYFSTNVMTAAEAALLDEHGKQRVDSDGKLITADWEVNGESIKWVCSDSSIKPFRNNNSDIFPASELIKYHKAFISKPVCIDHKSSSVDGVRGIILDTYYDYNTRKVIALMAVDKVLYPDLAKKISTGVSSSVSMGTVVKKAICYDCGKVARSERDFCKHMKKESQGYGEINCELEPIEISIVNNPADPSAKIRTIFASVQKLQNAKYSSSIKERTEQLERSLDEIRQKLEELKGISDKEDESMEIAPELSGAAPEITADFNALFTELKILKSSMEKTLEELNKKQEDIMTDRDNSMDKKAYFQGAGGVNEPTPGKIKYPADPLGESLREKEDKQMLQTKDFGGTADDPEKETVRPAGTEGRAARRKEALTNAKKNLSKEGYFQGGGGVNEPEPGKVKYEIDPGEAQARKEDKQMVGQKPFPGVGDVDGLHPSPESVDEKDELERKKMLARAGLKARFFRKAASNGRGDDLGNSGWQIFQKDEKGEKLVFTASVNEISGGQTDQLGEMIATKEFGSKMLEKVREVGVEKAASLYKRAQEMPPAAPPAAAPAAPGGEMDMAGPAAPAASPDAETKDAGGKGDKKETAETLAEKVRDDASDLLEVVRDINGGQAEMGELEEGISALPKAAASVLMPAAQMRRKLEKMLVSAAKKSLAELKEHYSELKLISEMADEETVKNASISSMIDSAFDEAKVALADSNGVLRSYATYASGVENLQARVKQAEEEMEGSSSSEEMSADDGELAPPFMFEDETDPTMDAFDLPSEGEHDLDQELGPDLHEEEMPETVRDHEGDMNMVDDKDMLEVELAPGQPAPAPGQPVPAGAVVAPKMASMDLTTKAGRSAYRAKLAADLGDSEAAEKIKFNPLMDEANKLADGQTELDVKPSDNLGRVETKPEVNKRMLEVARMAPAKVKKEAARLNAMIAQGAVKVSDLDKLVSEGLDAEVVKYWRDLYGQTDGGAEFAKMLTTAAEEEKAASDLEAYKVKLARSYELANEMARTGLITNERTSIARQVDESMKWNDEAFDSFKRVIAKRSGHVKTAGFVPQVGIIGSSEVSSVGSDDLQSELDRAFSNKRY
jgi:hypothetical protein